jgi:putative membrane-bound dehydrogenase-like protein
MLRKLAPALVAFLAAHFAIHFTDAAHPITKGLTDWTTINEELYNNVKMHGGKPLAVGTQSQKSKDGEAPVESVVAWTNEYGPNKTRIFSTTIGHNNETVADARYLDLVTRGLLWSCDKLNAEYLKPFTGKNEVTFIKVTPQPEKPKAVAATLPPAVKDGTPVTVTASSEESGKGNFAWKAVDGDADSRWCAGGSSKPQWLQIEFEQAHEITGLKIVWESKNNAYRYKVEASDDGQGNKAWVTLMDATNNNAPGDSVHDKVAVGNTKKVNGGYVAKVIRITCTGTSQDGWASIKEITVRGEGIKALAPKVSVQQQVAAGKEGKKSEADPNDPLKSEGNITPKIVKLTPQQEAEILKDAKPAEGFEATLFASSQAANYPVFISAAPDGTLYVSSDGNGSLGRQAHRGRILRLRDTDGDGRADEVKEFVKDVDSPRGLVVDGNTVYCIHPPHLSAFIDKDGDGIADEEKVLVKNIAFTFKDRPAVHTTNGMELGIDGWLYIAGGDFGFMEAEGTDGRKLQLRGGGIIRVRPDGTNLQLYSRGTRNILDAAISPLCDIFARDNTNDGGGWDVRFHHFTGFEDHGYPRLYKNFAAELITPLADYGGGSGCGACWIDEPGWPAAWNNLPYTSDWGRGPVFRHTVRAKGATFEETAAPEPLVKMTRSTDIDVDARGYAYVSSWKGPATFGWAGPDNGYIVRIAPKGHVAPKVPDFAKATDAELVKLLESPSHRTRLEAQRTLVRRTMYWKAHRDEPGASKALSHLSPLGVMLDEKQSLATRTAAGYVLVQTVAPIAFEAIPRLRREEKLASLLVRMAGELAAGQPESVQAQVCIPALRHENAKVRNEAVIAMGRFHGLTGVWADGGTPQPQQIKTEKLGEHATAIAPLLGDSDAVVAHTAMQVLRQLGASDACFAILDDPKSATPLRGGALMVLRGIHDAKTVDGLIARIATVKDVTQRQGLLAALCRLHFTEGTWKGDSWGTRPDTRGPYYQPEAWGETPKIAIALKAALANAQPEEAAFLVGELNRNRIQFNEVLQRILALAKSDAKLIPDAVAQLANTDAIPGDAVPLLVQAAQSKDMPANTLVQAVAALAKVDSADSARASLQALAQLAAMKAGNKEREAARGFFLGAPKLENHHQIIEDIAAKMDGEISLWADAALLTLSARKTGAPESRELSAKALDTGWQNPKRRAQILKAAGEIKHNAYADKILASLDDADKTVAGEARSAASKLKLEKKVEDAGPLIGTMQVKEVVAQVVKTKGDIALGEQLFTRNTCVACHTTSQEQAQKGPYLGNIAETYKRPDLAEAILDPGKTIAQGFATNMFTLKDGTVSVGFVTREAADKVTVRNIAAQESTFDVKDIVKRETLPTSLMPPGLVNNLTVKELAGLLDYLESLAKKK